MGIIEIKRAGLVRCLWVCALTFTLGAAYQIGHGADLPESTGKLLMAREIERTYIQPLGLSGRSASVALERMLSEGFRCDLRVASPIGLDQPPLLHCIKSPSGFASLCNELNVYVRFKRLPVSLSREALYQRLSEVEVEWASAFCGYPPPPQSAGYLSANKSAEARLSERVRAMSLLGNAKSAYEKLLLSGYYCGFERASAERLGPVDLVCTSWRNEIRYCYEARVKMELSLPAAAMTFSDIFKTLGDSEIRNIESTCSLPQIGPGGKAS